MPRFVPALGILVLSLALAAPGQGAQKPKPQAPRKPAAAKPAQKPAPPAAEPVKPPPPPTDVKMVTAYTHGAQVSQNTTYVKGARQRVEFPGVVSIDQCDLKRTLILSPATKKYRVQTYGAAPAAAPASPAPGVAATAGKGGVVVFTTTLTDTLERQTMFGLQARRIRTVVAKQADANACDKTPVRVEIDAWYVDLPNASASCARPAAAAEPPPGGDCQDRIEARVVGDVSLGFPVKTVTTTSTGDGERQDTMTMSTEVTALEVTSLDASLFEAPPDFSEATSTAEVMPAVATGGSLEEVLFGSTADGTSQAAAKKPGVTRVGVLEPVNKSGRTLNTKMLRQDLTGKFRQPFEALPLSGSSAAAIEADARRLECDYILLAEIAEVKSSKPGKLGGFLKAASGGGAPSKEVHEVKARYTLFATANTSAPKASGDVKASSSGGFGLGSALKMASFAGQMYMGMGMMRGMGGFGALGGLGMGMNPMAAVASIGGLGPMAGALYDPRAAAMTSMSLSMGMTGAMPVGTAGSQADPSDGEVYQTVSASFANVAKAATGSLSGKK